ncbi:MAG: hypothetical protein ACRYGP_04830 [Janthinobacterium lividum]
MFYATPDPVPAARALLAALPTLIEQADAARGPLKLATYGLRTALAEARSVVDAADRAGSTSPASNPTRRFGD